MSLTARIDVAKLAALREQLVEDDAIVPPPTRFAILDAISGLIYGVDVTTVEQLAELPIGTVLMTGAADPTAWRGVALRVSENDSSSWSLSGIARTIGGPAVLTHCPSWRVVELPGGTS